AGSQAMVSFRPPEVSPTVSLDPRHLPDYAARSTLRMFIALVASLLFTLLYGWIAAHTAAPSGCWCPAPTIAITPASRPWWIPSTP
ncbi:MAG: hypothetical protein ACKOZT_02345, partial [Cyanobium sp.]